MMNGLPLTFLCHWGGNILHQIDGCPYDIGPKRSIRAENRWSYNRLMNELYQVTKLDRKQFKLDVLCRFPYTFDHGIANFCTLPIEDDSGMESMFDCSARFVGMGSLQLYLIIESIDNRNEPEFVLHTNQIHREDAHVDPIQSEDVRGMDTRETNSIHGDSLNCCREFGSTSYTPHYDVGPSMGMLQTIIPFTAPEGTFEPHVRQTITDHGGVREVPNSICNEDLLTDSEDDEDYYNNRMEDEESEESSTSSSDIGEGREVGQNLVSSNVPENHLYLRADYPYYGDFGEGSNVNDVHDQELGAPICDGENFAIFKGLRFRNKIDMQNAIKRYHISNNWRYKVKKSTDQTWVIECIVKDYPCDFYLRGSLLIKKHNLWEVTRYKGPHTCLSAEVEQDHRHVDAKLIARELLGLVKEDADLKIRVVIQTIKDKLHKTVSYKKAWCGKQKAIAQIYGDWETSYQRMPRVLAAIKQYNPDTVVQFSNPPPAGTMGVFDRVFWAFGPCIRAFSHCRPVITIDGTFLHGRYRGVILIAIGVDANDSLIPLAFAIVEKEDFRNWHWFLKLVHQHIVKGREVCIISDRHKGILASFVREETTWPNTKHRFCLRHMRANFLEKHKGSEMKRLFWEAGCAHQDRKLKNVLDQMFLLDRESIKWFEFLDTRKWTLAHDGGYRYGMMTTNLSEIFNGVLKGARGMPITAMIETSFYRCVSYFNNRRGIANSALGNLSHQNMDPQNRFSLNIHARLSRYSKKVGQHQVTVFNRSEEGVYSVVTGRRMCKGGNVQVVRFGEGTCTCGKWLAYRVPCSHVMACCNSQHVDYLRLVSPYYNVESYYKTWSYTFEPLLDEAYWNEYSGPVFTPHPSLQRAAKSGRPRSRRIRNSMDFQGEKRIIHCSICKQQGHTRRKCPRNRIEQ